MKASLSGHAFAYAGSSEVNLICNACWHQAVLWPPQPFFPSDRLGSRWVFACFDSVQAAPGMLAILGAGPALAKKQGLATACSLRCLGCVTGSVPCGCRLGRTLPPRALISPFPSGRAVLPCLTSPGVAPCTASPGLLPSPLASCGGLGPGMMGRQSSTFAFFECGSSRRR